MKCFDDENCFLDRWLQKNVGESWGQQVRRERDRRFSALMTAQEKRERLAPDPNLLAGVAFSPGAEMGRVVRLRVQPRRVDQKGGVGREGWTVVSVSWGPW
jgi:hypothetical protein